MNRELLRLVENEPQRLSATYKLTSLGIQNPEYLIDGGLFTADAATTLVLNTELRNFGYSVQVVGIPHLQQGITGV